MRVDAPRRPIRVLRIIDRLNVGGPAIHAVLTSAGLSNGPFATLLVHGDIDASEGDMGYLLQQHAIHSLHLPSLARAPGPLQDLRTLLTLYRLMRRHRPDVVHTHKSKAGVLGRVAALLAGVPVRIHTYHGHVLSGYFNPVATRGLLMVERLLARGTTRLLTISEGLLGELTRERGVATSGRFRVVPLGLDLEPFRRCERHRGELREELGLPAETALVGVVGRMVPIKDHATFLQGLALLRRQPGLEQEVHAVLVGSGELEGELRLLAAQLGLTQAVHFLGWRRDLPTIYADLDALALTSRNEGTPVTLIEGLAAGVPVVATFVGGVPDVLRGGARGLMIPPGDPGALARALQQTLSDPALKRHSQEPALRDAVCQEYGIARLCQDLGRLYEEELRGLRSSAHKGVAATDKGQ